MGIKAKQLKQLLSRLADETEITGIELTFVDNPAAPTTRQTETLSFEKDAMALEDISIKAESSASVATLSGRPPCPCPPYPPCPPRPYYIY